MKYEQYSKLSPELQKEYDYRFKGKQFNVNIGLVNLLILWAFLTLSFFVSYAVAISPNHLGYPYSYMMDLMSFAHNLTIAIVGVYVLECLYYLGYVIYKFVEEQKWRKNNDIGW